MKRLLLSIVLFLAFSVDQVYGQALHTGPKGATPSNFPTSETLDPDTVVLHTSVKSIIATNLDIRDLSKLQDNVYSILKTDAGSPYDARDRNWTITETVTVTGPLTDTQLRASPVPTSLASTTLTSTVQPTGLTSILTGQLAVTATAQQLPANAGKIVCIRVKDGGTQNVYFGPSGVTTATGQELIPSEGVCRPTDNTNRYFVIAGGTGSTIAWEVHN